jgi:hypothetical protein
LLEAEAAKEGFVVRLPAEEAADELVPVDGAAPFEDGSAVVAARRRVEGPCLFEVGVHVVAEDMRPEVAVVAGVVAKEVAKT